MDPTDRSKQGGVDDAGQGVNTPNFDASSLSSDGTTLKISHDDNASQPAPEPVPTPQPAPKPVTPEPTPSPEPQPLNKPTQPIPPVQPTGVPVNPLARKAPTFIGNSQASRTAQFAQQTGDVVLQQPQFAPRKNKKILLVVIVIGVLLLLGILVFAIFLTQKTNTVGKTSEEISREISDNRSNISNLETTFQQAYSKNLGAQIFIDQTIHDKFINELSSFNTVSDLISQIQSNTQFNSQTQEELTALKNIFEQRGPIYNDTIKIYDETFICITQQKNCAEVTNTHPSLKSLITEMQDYWKQIQPLYAKDIDTQRTNCAAASPDNIPEICQQIISASKIANYDLAQRRDLVYQLFTTTHDPVQYSDDSTLNVMLSKLQKSLEVK